jgi:hypothetical protein
MQASCLASAEFSKQFVAFAVPGATHVAETTSETGALPAFPDVHHVLQRRKAKKQARQSADLAPAFSAVSVGHAIASFVKNKASK